MTTHEDYWLALSHGARVADLERDESLRLLAAKKVGRLAFWQDSAPTVLPMNYVLVDDRVVVRTVAHGAAARALGTTVAFEVDDIDDFLEAGWSVLVVGTAELLTEEQVGRLRLDRAPEPWAEGPRTLFLAIGLDQVTGRRVG